MKAAVIYEHGGPGSVRYVADFPDPKPAAGEVVVRVRTAALNYPRYFYAPRHARNQGADAMHHGHRFCGRHRCARN